MGKVELRVYIDYDLTGGSPPFGHKRTTHHVELQSGKDVVVRNGEEGKALIRLVEQGEPIGDRGKLPSGMDYSNEKSYKQEFSLLTSLQEIEKKVPDTPILLR